jgi:hypothetical protein
MSILGVNGVATPTVDVDSRASQKPEASKINDSVTRAPDSIDQQTAARAAAGDKQVSDVTQPLKDSKSDSEKNNRPRVSDQLGHALTQQAVNGKTTAEF